MAFKNIGDKIREKDAEIKRICERYTLNREELNYLASDLRLVWKGKSIIEILSLIEKEVESGYDIKEIRQIYNIKESE